MGHVAFLRSTTQLGEMRPPRWKLRWLPTNPCNRFVTVFCESSKTSRKTSQNLFSPFTLATFLRGLLEWTRRCLAVVLSRVQTATRFGPLQEDFVLKKRTRVKRTRLDGSHAGGWVRPAPGTSMGTQAANPVQRHRQLKSDGALHRLGLPAVHEDGSRQGCPLWTDELGEQPILNACADSLAQIPHVTHPMLLAL